MTFSFLTIFRNNRFPSWILAIWLLWTCLHIWVATEMGYNLQVAVIDSLTYNLLLAFAATIPFGLGWLVLLPVLAGSAYASYRDIFVA